MDGSEVIAGLRGWTDVPDPRALGPRAVPARRSPPSTPAPTTTWSSRSAWTSCSPGCGRRSAAARPAPAQPTIATDDFTVDLAAGRVTADGTDVRLTPTEWHLLEVLARNPGRVVDHGRLLTEVWGPAYREQTNYLRVYMATLRRKLEPDAAQPRHLLTEAGRGYRFEP